MIFPRSIPARLFTDHRRYRSLLRRDFRFRCAYCLTHEFYFGGEPGGDIDHHRPQNGPYARPDLTSVYENLYWACRECNQNKGDQWPSPEYYSNGIRFLDSCRPEDDHDFHWRTHANGTVEALTPVGEYTIERLMLWREQLARHRERCFRWQQERTALIILLTTRDVSDAHRQTIEQTLTLLQELIEPPVFPRPRRADGRVESDNQAMR